MDQEACVAKCSYGYAPDANGVCSYKAERDFQYMSWSSSNNNSQLSFDSSCNPPASNQWVWTFNGIAQSLDIGNFVAGGDFSIRSWFLPSSGKFQDQGHNENMHAIIFSMEAEVWDSDSAWEHFDTTCHLDNNIPRDRVRVAFGLDSCHRGMLSITDSNGLT
jgi:hypothetical protein